MSGLLDFMTALRTKENSGVYDAGVDTDVSHFGAYQFNLNTLKALGYITSASTSVLEGDWTGRNGVNSLEDWYGNEAAQDQALIEWIYISWGEIRQYDIEHYADSSLNGERMTMSGMFAAAHLVGVPRFVNEYIVSRGTIVPDDDYETTVVDYFGEFNDFDFSDTSGIDPSWLPVGWSDRMVDHHEWGKTLQGGTGNDILYGFGGGEGPSSFIADDVFIGASGGTDQLYGGSDETDEGDVLTYEEVEETITLSLVVPSLAGLPAVFHAAGESGWHDYFQGFETLQFSDAESVVDRLQLSGDAALLDALALEGIAFDGGLGDDDTIDGHLLDGGAEIDFAQGRMGAAGGSTWVTLAGWENATGTGYDDVLAGDGGDNVLVGGGGADSLNGGAGADTLVFDAADLAVLGGDGFDVAVAGSVEGICLDLTANGIEAAIGEMGDDDFTTDANTTTALAGLDGADTFHVASGSAPTIIWGGEGADTILLDDPGAGILVCSVDNLDASNFHLLSLDAIAPGIDWSAIDAVIVNPDSVDTILLAGQTFGTTTTVEWPMQPGLYTTYGDAYLGLAGTNSTLVAGATVFGTVAFAGGAESHTEFIDHNGDHYLDVEWYPDENGDWVYEGGVLDIAEADYVGEWTTPEAGGNPFRTVMWYTDPVPYGGEGLWFVAGGSMNGGSLVSNNAYSLTLPDADLLW